MEANRYRIAVLCATDFGMDALRYMLGGEHRSTSPYDLGLVGDHYVVLAYCPENDPAATLNKITELFSSIEVVFHVGIGECLPSNEHDIRLGDVVISTLGDTEGRLDRAVAKMQFQQDSTNNINDYVSALLGNRLSIYKRPLAEADILFKPDCRHISNHNNTCENCDKSMAIDRPPRKAEISEIHYGLVASRGVMRSVPELPCIVIRGISDYGDSHKNNAWQHYAAAAAAGCTYELLYHLSLRNSEYVGIQSAVLYGTGILHTGHGYFGIGGNVNISWQP